MNEQLKHLNRVIKVVNHSIQNEKLIKFNPLDRSGREQLEELWKIKAEFNLEFIDLVEFQNLILWSMALFGNNTLEIKRTVKNDQLVSMHAVEKKTFHKIPLAHHKFLEMSKIIKFKYNN